jgi:hypothetical protein
MVGPTAGGGRKGTLSAGFGVVFDHMLREGGKE